VLCAGSILAIEFRDAKTANHWFYQRPVKTPLCTFSSYIDLYVQKVFWRCSELFCATYPQVFHVVPTAGEVR
jgi:hypothetical protein